MAKSKKSNGTKNTSKAVKAPSSTNLSVDVRVEKISNGFIITESRETKTGFSRKQTYSKKKPIIKF